MWTTITVTAAAAAFGSFAWGVRGHFRVQGSLPWKMRGLSLASAVAFLLFAILIFRQGVAPLAGMASTALSAAATTLFWWAVRTTRNRPPAVAHTAETPTMIYEGGPYRYVRHPFYLSYSLCWIGTAIAAGWPQWCACALLIAWYYGTAQSEEENFAQSPMASAYAEYSARTGMIFPRASGKES